jgi:hypothetical protein
MRLRVALLTAVVLTAAAAPADAYRLGGRKWPTRTITYYVAAKQHLRALKAAASDWNRSGARIRFKRVTSRRRAKLVIVYERGGAADWLSHGRATLGYTPGFNRMWLPRLKPGRNTIGAVYSARMIAVHEFGHNIGLNHETRRCATMNPSLLNFSPQRCPRTRPWQWRCRAPEVDDVRGAIRRYGGRARRRRAVCDVYRAIAAPAELAAGYNPDANAMYFRFRRPADTSPRGLFPFGFDPNAGGYWMELRRDACPRGAPSTRGRYAWDAPVGGFQAGPVQGDYSSPGRYCLGVWAVDRYGRPGRGPATTTFDVSAPPPEQQQPEQRRLRAAPLQRFDQRVELGDDVAR